MNTEKIINQLKDLDNLLCAEDFDADKAREIIENIKTQMITTPFF
jgi:chemotaxis receptor (MCP) glutamine deamidase CheD